MLGAPTRTGPLLGVAARTDAGMRRTVNEDALLAADPCFLVADGMGGHEAGDRASRAAIAAFAEVFTKPGPATLAQIEQALGQARGAVHEIAAGTRRGAGCTLTGVIRIDYAGEPYWYVLNVGDSRVYLCRGRELVQLTQDHSLLEERRRAGGGQGAVAAASTPRNAITRALGSEDDRHDAWLLPLETGSRLLVCSDGLTGEVGDEELGAVLAAAGPPVAVADELLDRARAAGGRDNITVIVVEVVAGGVDRLDVPAEVHAVSGADAGEDLAVDEDTIERTRPVAR